jgi:predicted kinase
MRDLTLFVVSGLPASGKTTLARWLASELRVPLVGRDDIKERLFDSLGWSDRAWSKRLGAASWDLLYWFIETQLAAGQPCMAESNFSNPGDAVRLRELVTRYNVNPVEVHCFADGSVLVERYLERVRSGQRHPGHVDDVTIDEQRERLLAVTPSPLMLGGAEVLVDTSNPATIDYDWLLGEILSELTEEWW